MARRLPLLFFACTSAVIVILVVFKSVVNRGTEVLYKDSNGYNEGQLKLLYSKEKDGSQPQENLNNEIEAVESCMSQCRAHCARGGSEVLDDQNEPPIDYLETIYGGDGGVDRLAEERKEYGYMISFRYWEQQTQATRNFLQLQCLAHSYGMKTVEPFITGSSFSLNVTQFFSVHQTGDEFLRLSDLIDIDLWNKQTAEKYGYQAVSKWEDFIHNAPKKIIINCIRYRNPPHIHVPEPGFDFKKGCTDECFKRFDKTLHYLKGLGFKLVRKTCSNFYNYAGSVTSQDFLNNILGKYKSSKVSVLLNEFRGFFGLYRLPILSECGIQYHKVNISVMPSKRILGDATKYSNTVLKGQTYVAVLVRVERVVLHLHHDIQACAREVKFITDKLNVSRKTSEMFLAMDVGKFGSNGAALKNLQPSGEQFLEAVLPRKQSFEEWEKSFESSASSNNPAYIANLQRTIAARGECLIIVGAGGFQGQARKLYEQFHPDKNTWCVYKVCSNDKQ